MPNFTYTARDKGGTLQTGRLDAVNEDQVVNVLQGRGLVVTSVIAGEELARTRPIHTSFHRTLHARATMTDKVQFCDELAVLLESGVTLMRGLEVLTAQVESRALLAAIAQMRQDLEAGKTFRDAMARHPHLFSNFWISLVETGEASGHLGQSLRQLAQYLETLRQLQTKALTALTYPALLVGAISVALTIFLVYIIPVFQGLFDSMRVPLPPLTLLVLAVSLLARKYFLVGLGAGVVAAFFLTRFLGTPQGRWLRDRLLLRAPIFKRFVVELQLAQFHRGMGTLLESGVPILAALEIMERSATNSVYAAAVGEIQEAVRQGKSMVEPMGTSGLFPPMALQMVQVGEEVGELSKMLSRVAQYYEERVDTFLQRLGLLFEPVTIIVMAVVIGSLVIAMYLPLFNLVGQFR